MTEIDRHPRYLEGALRHGIRRICRANANGHDALDRVDTALGTLYALKRQPEVLQASVAIVPFISIIIREYEDIRTHLTPLSSGVVPKPNDIESVKKRLELLNELIDCFGEQRTDNAACGRTP